MQVLLSQSVVGSWGLESIMQEHEGGKAVKETGLQTCLEEVAGNDQRGRCTYQTGSRRQDSDSSKQG